MTSVGTCAIVFACWIRSKPSSMGSERESEGNVVPESLQPLLKCSDTLIVSTAECERAFSSMNDTLTDSRNQLSIKRLSALMFVKIVGPPLPAFKPMQYVRSWILARRRCADYHVCKKRKPNNQNDYEHLAA